MRWIYALYLSPLTIYATISNFNFGQFPSDFVLSQDQLQNHDTAKQNTGKRQSQSIFLNNNTKKFAVNGTGIPDVDFDVGESYAGLLPISDANDTNQLYFWFFPSTNPAAEKEIVIWLTGGPGCSSTGELLQENGPFLWQPGVFRPVKNEWSWHELTNIVWIDQPVGSGFSQGIVTAKDEIDVAQQFMGFWKNFVDAFSMQGYKVYITGSSYSGMYCPYIASMMIDSNDTTYFNVSGMQIWDGVFSKDPVAEDIPTAAFVDKWQYVFSFNDTFTDSLHKAAQDCGYTDYMNKYLVFPPVGPQPTQLPGQNSNNTYLPGCNLFNVVAAAALEANPCFSFYEIFNRCPLVYDPLGFSGATDYVPAGSGPVYFDRPDVKAAINAPVGQKWVFCSEDPVFINGTDNSLLAGPGSQPVLPNVIDHTKNVIIGHGSQDFILIADGTLLAIQNLTFGGQLGFQNQPKEPLFVPYHSNNDITSMAGAGIMGTAHTERGLTYLGVAPAGHFLAMNAPAVAFRSLEVLLGRVDDFQSTQPFTTDTNSTAQPPLSSLSGVVGSAGTESRKGLKSGGSIVGSIGMCRFIFWAGIPIATAMTVLI